MRNEIMGVSFDDLTLEEAVRTGEALAEGPDFSYVVTPNPEIVNMARQAEDYKTILNQAALVLPDGIGVVYAARILGRPLKGRVPGIDFASGLLDRLKGTQRRLFLLGAKPGVAEQAAENLKQRYPGLVICGTHDGYFQDAGPVVEAIRAAEADVVFVCLGAPKQERWMARYGPQTGARLMVGLGGVLDVYAGNVKRAPEVWQKAGMEWLYRLLHQPSRFGRMAKLPLFLVEAARESRKKGSA
ncbi:MAG: WecB/TagA/CpsF family glycosyltransferase [Evtepia sp.]|uniref:WecB/TagA/CpsF family glycosyltransferase n=1 Tax=Evtepia sp. TaxID=2773933 RepID=UPI002A74DCDA|nr:WecB/TagA/CpsF family glycosyltransferase [Evtepia sp.]MDY3013900.1 WecB/TagA/CpsF family glycosyltransferase [Evtepia sp.]